MPFSTAGPVSRHRLALGRIPGLEMDNIIVLPGVPGRQFLSSEQYCKAANLEDRQIVNGAILVQTVGWFLEFAPTDEQDVHYKQQFVSIPKFLVIITSQSGNEAYVGQVGLGPRRDQH